VLFQEAAERRAVVAAMAGAFSGWGYAFVETPAVEEYRTLETAAGGSLEGTAFRLIDLDGSLLALRPEMTLPIARLVATRLDGEEGPHRICYAADVFRERESLRGDARQFTQVAPCSTPPGATPAGEHGSWTRPTGATSSGSPR